MKKKIIIWLIVLAILAAVVIFTVINLAKKDATESESYITTAYISYEMDLTREIEVDHYMTYSSNDLIRIFDKDGVEYLTNSKNVILIKEHEKNDE